MAGKILLMVGTQKGIFFFESDGDRRQWKMTPQLPGWEICSLLGEPGGGRIYAGTAHFAYGPTVRVSDDLGESWMQMEGRPEYSKESGFKLNRIWQLVAGHPSEPGTIYAGVDEAGLFVSRDRGESWNEVTSLTNHRTRSKWFPGAGGLCLHTILIDPGDKNRMWIGISAVGAFRSVDGGESWKLCNKGLGHLPTGSDDEETVFCVHKMVLDPKNSNTLYMQYHGGVFRSTDGADSWQAIESGLPSNFGFPMVITRSGDLFIAPLKSDGDRTMPDGKFRVYRSHDGGKNWDALSNGLPSDPQYVGVLRDAMAVDPLEPAGVYVGTTMGEVFYSADAGENWAKLPATLPRITNIKTCLI